VIGIGEFDVAKGDGEVLRTLALGSCVAVLFHDSVSATAGLIHVALPESKVNPAKAQRTPGYFVDTGLPAILEAIVGAGASPKRMRIKLVGGASMMDPSQTFDIGRRNVLAIKRYLWKNGLGVIKEDVGGSISRTVEIAATTGEVTISSGGKKWSL
jgi:chemotaxis protein CheD